MSRRMQKLGSIAAIISCVLLTLEFGSSAEAATETNTKTPALWSAFGCVVTEDNITLCRQRVQTEKTKADKKEEDSEEEPGFFESITDFMMDGLVRLFEGEQPSDKDKEEDDENKVKNEPEESEEPGLFDDDVYDKDDKKGENNIEDYDGDDGYKDEKDVDVEKNDDDEYDEKDEYDDDWEEYHNDTSNVVDASNSTSVKTRRKRDDSGGNQQGGNDEGRKDKKKNKDSGLMQLMMMGMFLQSKMSTMMMMFDGVMRLKSFAMSMMNFMLRIIQLYMDYTKQNKSEPHKVIYYEQAHHEHAYDQTSHEDNSGGWPKSLKDGKDGQEPQNLVYSAYVPSS